MSVRYIPRAEFSELERLDALACYRWGDRMVNHCFCRTCGIYPLHDATFRPGAYRVNLGCIEGDRSARAPDRGARRAGALKRRRRSRASHPE